MQKSLKTAAALALASLALAATVPAAGFATASADVCPSGCAYTSIQAALDAAAPGATITVGPGTYAGALVVAKDGVTLRGTDRDSVVVDARAPKTYGIHVKADDVTLESLTVLGPNTANLYGIHASRAPAFIHGLTLRDLTVLGSLRSEIDIHGARDALVENVAAHGQGTGGVGIAFTDSKDVLVRDVATSGNAWGGIAVYASGRFVAGGSDNVMLAGTNALAEADALYSETHNGHSVTNVHVEGQFAHVLTDSAYPTYTWWFRTLDDAWAFMNDPTKRPTPVTAAVSDLARDSFVVLPGMRIQSAVDAADAGDAVDVRAGAYAESVTVGKALTLRGAQAGVGAAGRSGAETVLGPGPSFASFYVTAPGVVIDGFSLDASGSTATNKHGVVGGSQLVVRNNVVRGFTIGVAEFGSDVLIEDNWFDSNNMPGSASGDAIYVDLPGSNVAIRGNTFTGHAVASMVFVGVGGRSNVDVTSNVFDGDNSLVFFAVDDVSISGNAMLGMKGSAVFLGGATSNVDVTGNIITDGAFRAVRVADFWGSPNSDVRVNGNTLRGNGYDADGRLAFATVEVAPGAHVGPLDATGNYWGSPLPPADHATVAGADAGAQDLGLGAPHVPPQALGLQTYAGDVAFAPWCLDEGCSLAG